jgi:hypothetical protein
MIVTITTSSLSASDFIYDLLTTPTSGCSCLSGVKTCIDTHEAIPDILEFDLNPNEIKALEKYDEVLSVNIDSQEVKLLNIVTQQGIPRLASFTYNFTNNNTVSSSVPHHLYYCQLSALSFTHENPFTNGSELATLSSVDCSNVDIIVMDSGVDITCGDLKDSLGNSTVVQYDWTQLKEGDPATGTQIVASIPANYHIDYDGHGTACASLAAGKKCGFAKNAKIYSLKANGLDPSNTGFSVTNCLRLALAFQKAKKQNLYGLDSSRPTVFTNSWGYVGPVVALDINHNTLNQPASSYENTKNFAALFGTGKGGAINFSRWWNDLPGSNSTTDAYFRQIIAEGVHTLVAAGNSNVYLKNNNSINFDLHYFSKNESFYAIPRDSGNNNLFIVNNSYNGYSFLGTFNAPISYSSPNIGQNPTINLLYNKETYPVIIVGDIIPIGKNESDNPENSYWTGGYEKSYFDLLSSYNGTDVIVNETTNYNTVSGPFFAKSQYSSFGPDVDVYAPGNAAWAAMTNNISYGSVTVPKFYISNTEKYEFFNGTSAACPIAAGILATFLSKNPYLTPLEAKNWLLTNSVSGNIMETTKNVLNVENGTAGSFDLPFGSNLNLMLSGTKDRLRYGPFIGDAFGEGSQLYNLYRTGNIYNLLFGARFFDSNNIIPQASLQDILVTPTPTPTSTPTRTPTITPSNTPSSTIGSSPTPTQTPSNTPTNTLTPSKTPNQEPSSLTRLKSFGSEESLVEDVSTLAFYSQTVSSVTIQGNPFYEMGPTFAAYFAESGIVTQQNWSNYNNFYVTIKSSDDNPIFLDFNLLLSKVDTETTPYEDIQNYRFIGFVSGLTSIKMEPEFSSLFSITNNFSAIDGYTLIWNPAGSTYLGSRNFELFDIYGTFEEEATPTPTPTPTTTPIPNTPTPTTTSVTLTPTRTPTKTPTNTPTNTPSQTSSSVLPWFVTKTPTSTPTKTQTPTKTKSFFLPTPNPSVGITGTPTPTPTQTNTPSQTKEFFFPSTPTKTLAITLPVSTSTPTRTPTKTSTPTRTSTNTPSKTSEYFLPSVTRIINQTGTPTPTPTNTPTPSQTKEFFLPSATPSKTPTSTPTQTNTPTSETPTPTPTPTPTETVTPTPTETVTPTPTETVTPTPTNPISQNICVSNAGNILCNGTYEYSGVDNNGFNSWSLGVGLTSFVIKYEDLDDIWELDAYRDFPPDVSIYFAPKENSLYPPTTGWQSYDLADEPAPILSYSECLPTPTQTNTPT